MNTLDLSAEFLTLNLGDKRLNERALSAALAIAVRPDASFPGIFPDEGQLEGFYRLVNNDAVTPDVLGTPHHEQSWRRAAAAGPVVLALHDTSEFTFAGTGTREWLTQKGASQSTHTHLCLLVGEDERPVVHGVVGHQFYVQQDGAWVRYIDHKKTEELVVKSHRWSDEVRRVQSAAPAGLAVVHVMDREGDDFVLYSTITEVGADFVIRSAHDRRTTSPAPRLSQALTAAPISLNRAVSLGARNGRRPPGSQRRHPPRHQRDATLAVRAGRCTIPRPRGVAPVGEATLDLNVVEVIEESPPEGEKPVTWRLLTSLPVDTPGEIARVVDIYRKRWLIEEYFKALKTGCAAEKRQARSWDAMVRTFTLLIPVAWRLLRLRALSRPGSTAKWDAVIDSVELHVLKKKRPKHRLSKRSNARSVLLAIASLGGHIKNNGEPGWQVLGRGLQDLLVLTAGFRLALEMSREGEEF